MWKFFEVSTDNGAKVVRKQSDVSLSREGKERKKTFNTTNLRKHLQSKHKQEFEKERIAND